MKCPNCKHTLIVDDVFDTEHYEDEMFLKISGFCDYCDKTYVWTEHYELVLKEEKIIQED